MFLNPLVDVWYLSTAQFWNILVLDFGGPSISGSIRSIKMYSWA